MLKFIQTTRIAGIVFGSAALIALIAAAPVSPAAAQSAPAGLLRLDPPQSSSNEAKLTQIQQPKVRAAYARANRKNIPAH